jgi:steroid 5-alpha reductase family enzyme
MIQALLTAWALVACMMLVLWLVQAKLKNASYVDIGWTFGLLICAIVYATQTGDINSRKLLVVFLVAVWSIRLGLLLIKRLIKDPSEDSRYAKIRVDWKTNQNRKFFFMFQFQGLLDVVLSWGFLVICLNPSDHFSTVEYIGRAVWIIGFLGESIADGQLKKFKENPLNKGKTCQSGLWNYSRHPNYFFEWLIWVGYFLMALTAPWGWTTIILPVLMYYFLMHVSGVPLAEAQSLKTKGEDYRRYQQSTSMFVPWFKR